MSVCAQLLVGRTGLFSAAACAGRASCISAPCMAAVRLWWPWQTLRDCDGALGVLLVTELVTVIAAEKAKIA